MAFLGHVVFRDGNLEDPKKVGAKLEWPRSTIVIEVRRFLGLISYYRTFVKDFSKITVPLTELTQKISSLIGLTDVKSTYSCSKIRLLQHIKEMDNKRAT